MNLFGNKKGMILLIIAAICLFAFVVWPFVLGGRSNIQTEFLPMNVQMQEMISQTEEEPTPEIMPTKKQDSKSTIDTDSKSAKPSTRPSIQPTTQPTTTQPSATQPEASTSAVPPAGQLDLNTATLEQLNALPGIGESKARAILDYRIKKGRFSRIDELTEVKGIGEKMLAKLKEFLYVTTS